jgi:catechol 2,3-dioxygenase-like lactoylglutathione lyase family enzyme
MPAQLCKGAGWPPLLSSNRMRIAMLDDIGLGVEAKGRNAMHALALDHVVVEVSDVARALDFYAGLLGLPSLRREEFFRGEAPFVSVRCGSSLIDLLPVANPHPCSHHLCVELAEPLDRVLAELAAHNVAADPPRRRFGARGWGFSVYVRDPDGHVIELRSYQ